MELQENKMEPEENATCPLDTAKDAENPDKCKEDFFTFKEDVPDIPPKSSEISNFDIFFLVLSIVTHCTDVCVDINIILQYYLNNKFVMFQWTIGLVLIPSFINTVVSLQMYHQDKKENTQANKNKKIFANLLNYIGMLFSVTFTVVFQFTMAQRTYYSLKYALKSRSCAKKDDRVGQRRYFLRMLKEEQDIALLRVLECFIEAAPQQVLQLSIFVTDYYGEFSLMSVHQVISIASSFISLAWAMVSYHRSIRLAQVDKKNIDLIGTILQFVWYLLITTSRIATVSAVAMFSVPLVLISGFIHWITMTLWISFKSRGLITFCRNKNHPPHLPLSIFERTKSTLFSCVLGFVYISIYLNPEDTGTYTRHLIYYSICFIENIIGSILVLCSIPANFEMVIYHYLVSAFCVIPFVIGIIVMIVYYIKYHPSMKHHTYTFSKLLRI